MTAGGSLPNEGKGGGDRQEDVIGQDVILLWTDERKRVITGADVLVEASPGYRTKTEQRIRGCFYARKQDMAGTALSLGSFL